jgi:hypothetical protein
MFVTNLSIKFHILSSKALLAIATKQKTKENFCTAAIMLSYTYNNFTLK